MLECPHQGSRTERLERGFPTFGHMRCLLWLSSPENTYVIIYKMRRPAKIPTNR